MLDIKLMECKLVHKGLHEIVRGKVEDQPKGDGDGEGWQRLLEDGEQQQGKAQALWGRTGAHSGLTARQS